MTRNVLSDQANTFALLAQILHVKRNKIAALVARKRHPLPLPPRMHDSERFCIDDRYLRLLRKWVIEEQTFSSRPQVKLDFAKIERELTSSTCPDHSEKDWSVDDCLDHFPPGDFLG